MFKYERIKTLPVSANARGSARNPAPAICATKKKEAMPYDSPFFLLSSPSSPLILQ